MYLLLVSVTILLIHTVLAAFMKLNDLTKFNMVGKEKDVKKLDGRSGLGEWSRKKEMRGRKRQ